MAYTQDSIQSNTPVTDLIAAIEAQFNAHGNWDFVENFTNTGGTTFRVWKNRGSGTQANLFGQDFFLYYQVPDETTTPGTFLRIRACEQWDVVNKKAINPCHNTGNWTTTEAGNLVKNGSNAHNPDFGDIAYSDLLVNNTGFGFFIQLSKDRLCAGTKFGTTDTGIYAGFFEPFTPDVEPYPLVISSGGANNLYFANAATSRIPAVAGVYARYAGCYGTTVLSQTSGTSASGDMALGGAALSSPVLVNKEGEESLATYGFARGTLIGVCAVPNGPTATRSGDSITVAGERWIRIFTSSGEPRTFVREGEL